jgi:hypothetical protein
MKGRCCIDRAVSAGMDAFIPRFQRKKVTEERDTSEGGPDQGDAVDEHARGMF